MIKLIARIIVVFITNVVGLALAAYFVKGFWISADPLTYLKVAAIFTALNILVRPILKLLFTPLVIITLGIGILVVNAIILYLLYRIYPLGVSIDMTAGLYPLVYATLIISAVHFVIGFAAKRAYKD